MQSSGMRHVATEVLQLDQNRAFVADLPHLLQRAHLGFVHIDHHRSMIVTPRYPAPLEPVVPLSSTSSRLILRRPCKTLENRMNAGHLG
jgi:hypothetical protein